MAKLMITDNQIQLDEITTSERVNTNSKFVDETGIEYGVKHVDNRMATSSKPYIYDIAEGNITGVDPIRRMGHNGAVGATYETIWCASSLYVYLTSAEKLKINSSEAEDKIDGTGARTLFIKGLNGDYDVTSETISTHATDGTTAVETVNSYLRVFAVRVETSGTDGTNKGNISIKNNASDNTVGYVQAGEGKTLMCVFTVPNGKTAIITRWAYGEVAVKLSEVSLFIRPYGKSWYIGKDKFLKEIVSSSTFSMPLKFSAKTDIEIRAWATAGSGKVSAMFEGYYY